MRWLPVPERNMPHPNSRAALLALNDRLRRESFARARVMEFIPLKREFSALQKAHENRPRFPFDSPQRMP